MDNINRNNRTVACVALAALTGAAASTVAPASAIAQLTQHPGAITEVMDPEWYPERPLTVDRQMVGPGLAPGVDTFGHVILPVSAGAPINAVYAESMHGTNAGLGNGVVLLDEIMLTRYRSTGPGGWGQQGYLLTAGSTYRGNTAEDDGDGYDDYYSVPAVTIAYCAESSTPVPAGMPGTLLCSGGGYVITKDGCDVHAWGNGKKMTFFALELPYARTSGRTHDQLPYYPTPVSRTHYYLKHIEDVETGTWLTYQWDSTGRLVSIEGIDGVVASLEWVGEGRSRRLASVADGYSTKWEYVIENQMLRTIKTPAGDVTLGYDQFGLLSRTHTTKDGTGFPLGTQKWERRSALNTSVTPFVAAKRECVRSDGHRTLVAVANACPSGYLADNPDHVATPLAVTGEWPVVVAYHPWIGTKTVLSWVNHDWAVDYGGGTYDEGYTPSVAVTDTVSKAWMLIAPDISDFYDYHGEDDEGTYIDAMYEDSSGARQDISMEQSFAGTTEEVSSYDPEGEEVGWTKSHDLVRNCSFPGCTYDSRFRSTGSSSYEGGEYAETSLVWVAANEFKVTTYGELAYYRVVVDPNGNPTLTEYRTAADVLWSETVPVWSHGLPLTKTHTIGSTPVTTTTVPVAGRPDRVWKVQTPHGTVVYEYDARGNVTSVNGPGVSLTVERNTRGGVKKQALNGRVTEVTEWHSTAAHPFLAPKSTTFPGGRYTTTMNASNFITGWVLEMGNHIRSSMVRAVDESGRTTATALGAGSATEDILMSHTLSSFLEGGGAAPSAPAVPTPTAESQVCIDLVAAMPGIRSITSFTYCKDSATMVACVARVTSSGQVTYGAILQPAQLYAPGKQCVDGAAGLAPPALQCGNTTMATVTGPPRAIWQ